MDPAPTAPIVFLYRRAILDEWIERGDVALAELVAHVLVHEVGHHFGLSDDHMDALLGRSRLAPALLPRDRHRRALRHAERGRAILLPASSVADSSDRYRTRFALA